MTNYSLVHRKRKKCYKISNSWKEPKRNKKQRRKDKSVVLRNKKLCQRYPWLLARNVWTDRISYFRNKYETTWLDDMPSGWRRAFGDLWCEDVHRELVKTNMVRKIRVQQLKEKYGQFRQYFSNIPGDLLRVIDDYEIVSEYICCRCGKLDSPIIDNYGWYEPVCLECFLKCGRRTIDDYKDKLKEVGVETLEDMKIPEFYTVRRYSKNTDKIEEVQKDISKLVQRIRYKNRKRRTNIDDLER